MNEKEHIKNKVIEILASTLDVDRDFISMDSTFNEDLGTEELDLFETASALEREFEISIPDARGKKIKTVGDCIVLIAELKGIAGMEAYVEQEFRLEGPLFEERRKERERKRLEEFNAAGPWKRFWWWMTGQ